MSIGRLEWEWEGRRQEEILHTSFSFKEYKIYSSLLGFGGFFSLRFVYSALLSSQLGCKPTSCLHKKMSAGKQQTCCFSFHAKDAASQHSLLDALSAITPVLAFPEATIWCFLTTETLCCYMKTFNSHLVINMYEFRQMPHLSGRKGY